MAGLGVVLVTSAEVFFMTAEKTAHYTTEDHPLFLFFTKNDTDRFLVSRWILVKTQTAQALC